MTILTPKLRRRLRRLITKQRHFHISTKITLIYALAFFLIMAITSVITGLGVYVSLYRSAEKSLQISIRQTITKMQSDENFSVMFSAEEPLLPGVVLRITDITGAIVWENDSLYPSIERVEQNIMPNPPVWANSSMSVVQFERSTIYYVKFPIMHHGHTYELHFFKTITAEKQFFTMLQRILLATNVLGFIIALLAGYFISNRILKPIRLMTQTARQIEVERMDKRIPTRPVRDELTELAKTFNHMLNRLQAGVARQQQFVSDASHELRTPVTVILGYADMLSRWGKDDPETLNEGLAAIKTEAEGMQQLIEKLLFLARSDQKRNTLKKENFELADAVADVMKKCRLVTDKHEVMILSLDDGMVYADRDSVKQMMRIFLENSIKYTPDGGRITADLKNEGDTMRLLLADNGIGIAPEHQEKIFERFYRVDSSRTKEQGGTGLGLAIARRIAEENDVTIDIVSDLGNGTTIELTFRTCFHSRNAPD